MSEIPAQLLHSVKHEYLTPAEEESVYYVGITDYAQGELGDIVYVELPKVGDEFSKNDVFGTIEAVKAVSDLYCPASGQVVEVNDALDADPAIVNRDPYGEGWLIKIRVSDPGELDELLDESAYADHIGES